MRDEIQNIEIAYPDGRILYQHNKTQGPHISTFTARQPVIVTPHHLESVLGEDGADDLNNHKPQLLGEVRVTTNDMTLNDKLQTILLHDVAIGSSALCVFLIISFYVVRRTTKRFRSLSKSVSTIATGKFEPAIAEGDDELANLARHINRMQQSLHEARSDVEKHISELVAARDDADRANVEKHDFLGQISKEIISPLQQITLQLEALADIPLIGLGLEQLEAAMFQVDYLHVLHHDLLEFYLQNTNRHSVQNRYFNVVETVERIVQSLHDVAEQKSLVLSTEYSGISALQQGFAYNDAIRFHQVLKELIFNALTYTMEGAVSVHVHFREGENRTVVVTTEVIDTGLGIPTEKQPQIFEQLQGNAPYDVAEGGSTGLLVAGRTAAAIGGRLTLRSREREGSVFTFELVSPFNSVRIEVPEAPRVLSTLRAAALFVAMPNSSTTGVAALLGLKLNLDVAIGHDCGLQKYQSKHYDIVLFEANPHTGEGFNIPQSIRNLSNIKLTPICATVDCLRYPTRSITRFSRSESSMKMQKLLQR